MRMYWIMRKFITISHWKKVQDYLEEPRKGHVPVWQKQCEGPKLLQGWGYLLAPPGQVVKIYLLTGDSHALSLFPQLLTQPINHLTLHSAYLSCLFLKTSTYTCLWFTQGPSRTLLFSHGSLFICLISGWPFSCFSVLASPRHLGSGVHFYSKQPWGRERSNYGCLWSVAY